MRSCIGGRAQSPPPGEQRRRGVVPHGAHQNARDPAGAQLAYEKTVLEQHTLLAPYDALVVDRQKELGTVIKAGDPVFTLVAAGSVWAMAYVDEARSGAIREGQYAEVRLRVINTLACSPKCKRVGHCSQFT